MSDTADRTIPATPRRRELARRSLLRRRRTVFARCRRPPTTHIRLVHDVVMHEGGEVHELHHRRHLHQTRRGRLRIGPAAEKHQRRADTFARGVDTVVGHRPDLRLKRLQLVIEKLIQRRHMRSHSGENTGKIPKRNRRRGRNAHGRIN
jgi:hypothetical protein